MGLEDLQQRFASLGRLVVKDVYEACGSCDEVADEVLSGMMTPSSGNGGPADRQPPAVTTSPPPRPRSPQDPLSKLCHAFPDIARNVIAGVLSARGDDVAATEKALQAYSNPPSSGGAGSSGGAFTDYPPAAPSSGRIAPADAQETPVDKLMAQLVPGSCRETVAAILNMFPGDIDQAEAKLQEMGMWQQQKPEMVQIKVPTQTSKPAKPPQPASSQPSNRQAQPAAAPAPPRRPANHPKQSAGSTSRQAGLHRSKSNNNLPPGTVVKSHKVNQQQLFWLKLITAAQIRTHFRGQSLSNLQSLDVIRGIASNQGVELYDGSVGDRHMSTRAGKVAPNTIQLKGPRDGVNQVIQHILKQQKILKDARKYTRQIKFKDDLPWAQALWATEQRGFKQVLNEKANQNLAWWTPISAAAASPSSDSPEASSPNGSMEAALCLASVEQLPGGLKLQVAYSADIARAHQADALVLSCGGSLIRLEQDDSVSPTPGVGAAFQGLKEKIIAAKQERFPGVQEVPPGELVAANFPKSNFRRRQVVVYSCHVPVAGTSDASANTNLLKKTLGNIIQHVKAHNDSSSSSGVRPIRSLALPLMGTLAFGHDEDTAATAIIGELGLQAAQAGLQCVTLMDERVEALEASVSALEELAKSAGAAFTEVNSLPVEETVTSSWYYYVKCTETLEFERSKRQSKGQEISDTEGIWCPFQQSTLEIVEEAYQRYLANPGQADLKSVEFLVDNIKYPSGIKYRVDFSGQGSGQEMRQVNTVSGFERRLKRKIDSRTHRKPDLVGIREMLKETLTAQRLEAAGVDSIQYEALSQRMADTACQAAEVELQAKFGVQTICIPLRDHQLTQAEQDILRNHLAGPPVLPVAVSFRVAAGGSHIQLTGLRSDLDTASTRILESNVYLSKSRVDFPASWSDKSPTQSQIVGVDSASSEWLEVADLFKKDIPAATVHKVERVQNALLWRGYQGILATMHEKYTANGLRLFRDDELMKRLWHGTGTTAPGTVVNSAHGWESVHSSTDCLWGQGCYFSTTSSYSDDYSHKLSSGQKQMVLAEVLTGIPFDSPQNKRLQKPPPIDAGHEVMGKFGPAHAPTNATHDCVTGITASTRVYITYNTGCAYQYPSYIVTYSTSSARLSG